MAELILTIKLSHGKGVEVSGPVHDKGTCYAMLELARDAIKDYKPQAIIPVAGFQVMPNGEQRRG